MIGSEKQQATEWWFLPNPAGLDPNKPPGAGEAPNPPPNALGVGAVPTERTMQTKTDVIVRMM